MDRKRQSRRVGPPAGVEISLTPLIDAVLVLLITFMVAMPVMQNSINIELPRGSVNDSPDMAKNPRDAITVYLDKQCRLFLNDRPVKSSGLIDELEKQLRGERDQVVFIKADRSVPCGDLVRIVDDIKYLGGVKYVALATQNE
ncbi:MAG: Biopolymer transport TolR [candidate division TM6 bacterium GW2011_GWF2_43_87]|nr:MAG: Biopolymer transport TolR [candidate division TM6 bacterium GW2011_GWF2_43_87]